MMDQQKLRELENQCIQEYPPECTTACPLHVDARGFVGRMAAGRWAEAWKILSWTMPFPAILGRICDSPCRERCVRGRAGDPIQIGQLERACVSRVAERPGVQILRSRGKRVAVLGSGLSSLTAAWDLVRKGYTVTLYEPSERFGGPLLEIGEERLPRRILEESMETLAGAGVTIRLKADPPSIDTPERLLKEHDVVYLGLDSRSTPAWDLGEVHPFTRGTRLAPVFAGGGSGSPVRWAAEGRWAAVSIDRILQGASLTAGREKEWSSATRLYTSLEGVLPSSAVPAADPVGGYAAGESVEEARRCLQCECLECVKVCLYLKEFGAYPKKYAREIYNNESMVMGTRQANRLINSCSLCGLCEAVCPEGFAMQDLCLEARQGMVGKGKMPPSAHEFALRDMEFSLSDRFALARHEPGQEESGFLFFPGCQLCGSSPGQAEKIYEHLRRTLHGGVGMILGCCGAPALWAGRQETFEHVLESLTGQWRALGEPKMVLACSSCYKIFRENLADIPVHSLWQVLQECGLPAGYGSALRPVSIHDPCTTRSAPEIQEAVRALLRRMNMGVQELDLSRGKTECCGFGGLMQNANPALAKRVARRRGEEGPLDYLTYCAMCRDSLASAGKRALHLLDLVFPNPEGPDPASRPCPGWSQRRENRAKLKERLLGRLWGERGDEVEEHRKIVLEISHEVQALLEDRRILVEDLQKVIEHAEQTGEKLIHPKTGRFKATFRPGTVTFWVEYSPSGKGYTIHNAYAHRMEVAGGVAP